MEKPGACRFCGEIACKKHSFLFENVKRLGVSEFSGSSPPEIFVGKWNYPNVYVGILSPQNQFGNTEILSSQELWHKNRLPMADIANLRSRLIYGRVQSNIKKALAFSFNNKFLQTMQEVAMASKSISAEFKLQKPIIEKNREKDSHVPLISNAAQVKSVRLEENPVISRKIDYLANDTNAKAATAILELEKSQVSTASIIKVLSAGLLGLGAKRKLVPTRWAISCVDSIISEDKISKIKEFPQINEYLVFNGEYLGNHYEILLIPRFWSFEVIEKSIKNLTVWKDYESFFKRKTYASNVTGGYYAARLPITEFLEKMKKQASVLVLREISPEYTQSMGVGILREISRDAFKRQPNKFSSLSEALSDAQTRLKLPIECWLKESQLIKELQQKTLKQYV